MKKYFIRILSSFLVLALFAKLSLQPLLLEKAKAEEVSIEPRKGSERYAHFPKFSLISRAYAADSTTEDTPNFLERAADYIIGLFLPKKTSTTAIVETHVPVKEEDTTPAPVYVTKDELEAALRSINTSVSRTIYVKGGTVPAPVTNIFNTYNTYAGGNSNTSGVAKLVSRTNRQTTTDLSALESRVLTLESNSGSGGLGTSTVATSTIRNMFSAGSGITYDSSTGVISASGGGSFSTSTTRSVFSSSATGLTYNLTTGDFSLTSGYNIPLTASTTDWNSFFTTPSTRITAGTGLSWTESTLNSSGLSTTTLNSLSPAVLVGCGNAATQATTTAVGLFNTANAVGAQQFGIYNGYSNSVIGAIGGYSITGGTLQASGVLSTSIGVANAATGTYATAVGLSNKAGGCCSSSFGLCNVSSVCRSVALGICNCATGNASIVVGGNNTASACYASALGFLNLASGPRSLASGHISCATGFSSTASGYRNCALATSSTAVGRNNSASGAYSSAFGANNTVSVSCSSAFGTGITNSTINSVQIGACNLHKLSISASGVNFITSGICGFFVNGVAIGGQDVDALNPIEVGSGNSVTNCFSSAIGYQNQASGLYASAVGALSCATGDCSSSFGHMSNALSGAASAVGYLNTATGCNSSAFGSVNTASEFFSSSFGSNNVAGGIGSSAFGYGNEACGCNSSAFGYQSTASGYYSAAFGKNNTATCDRATSLGVTNTSSGCGSSAVGVGNTAAADRSTASGYGNTAVGTYSSALGVINTAIGCFSTASGYGNTSSGYCASAFGYGNYAANSLASAFGSGLTNCVAVSTKIGPVDNISLHICDAGSCVGVFKFNGQADGTAEISGGVLTTGSDERLKNIQGGFDRGLDALNEINPILYTWKDSTPYDHEKVYAGFSAQNVKVAIPEAITTGRDGMLSLSDRPILAAVVNAVKELGGYFKDGYLKITRVVTDRLETKEVCIDDVCVNKEQLVKIINASNAQPTEEPENPTGGGEDSGDDDTNATTTPDGGGDSGSDGGSGDGAEPVTDDIVEEVPTEEIPVPEPEPEPEAPAEAPSETTTE